MFTFIKKVIKTGTATSSYPLEPIAVDKNFRGKPEQNPQQCIGCAACVNACPSNALTVETDLATGELAWEFNLGRCIFCGRCEEVCPTAAIQLTPDFEMGEYKRQDLVYEKEDLLISGPGKYPEYNFYRMAGMAIDGKDKGEAENEAKPIDVKSLLP